MRRFFAVTCAAIAVFFLIPLCAGIAHIGMFWPAAVLLLAAAWLLWGRGWPRLLKNALRILYAIGIAVIVGLSLWMTIVARHAPPEDLEHPTVIVLGCQVYDGKPSVMLRNRIDAAYGYLASHPDAVCIASGGMDDRETVTEAQCICDALLSMGITQDRICREDASRSTAENLSFSAGIISENGLSTDVVIATDAFHQLRGATFAKENGLSPYAVSCRSPWFLAAGYWCREMVGLAAMWVRGY